MKISRYKWVFCPAGYQGHPAPANSLNPDYYTKRLFNVGIDADGTLHNPNNYPDDIVRDAILAANARRHERRSKAAKEAAETRRQRTAKRLYAVAKRLTYGGNPVGPRNSCIICGRGLSDPPSIARGIGSECWQDVLTAIEEEKARLSSRQENVPDRLEAGRP